MLSHFMAAVKEKECKLEKVCVSGKATHSTLPLPQTTDTLYIHHASRHQPLLL